MLPKQAYMAVTDGYFVLVAPLSVGQHTIDLGGSTPGNGFTQNNTYTLTVAGQ